MVKQHELRYWDISKVRVIYVDILSLTSLGAVLVIFLMLVKHVVGS